MVLFKDQGLIHEIVTSVSYVDNIVWVATYFVTAATMGATGTTSSPKTADYRQILPMLSRGSMQAGLVWHEQGARIL